tara:strand:+ start:52 stop:1287 length:1236 start_codon:yes stop_codon:yes gene_type:complete
MTKKTRININTNFQVYFKTFISFFKIDLSDSVNNFYLKFTEFVNTKNIIFTSQGRVAALNIFKFLISKEKNEFIISPYTLTEVINAINYAGGKAKYVDIDIKTGLPDEKQLDLVVSSQTAGIIITHLYSNDDAINNFKKKYYNKIKIIEDTAINFGAKQSSGQYLGTIFDYGFFSFGVMKSLCTFNGGAIFVKDSNELQKIKNQMQSDINFPKIKSIKLVLFTLMIDVIYNRYIFKTLSYYLLKLIKYFNIGFVEKIIYPGVYPKISKFKPEHYNYKFCENFSYAGLINLKLSKHRHKNRINNVKIYEKELNHKLKIFDCKNYEINSFLEYPILLKKNTSHYLSKKLFEQGYDVRHTWYVNSLNFKKFDYLENEFPNSEQMQNYILSLPTNSYFNESDIIKICGIINKYEE